MFSTSLVVVRAWKRRFSTVSSLPSLCVRKRWWGGADGWTHIRGRHAASKGGSSGFQQQQQHQRLQTIMRSMVEGGTERVTPEVYGSAGKSCARERETKR